MAHLEGIGESRAGATATICNTDTLGKIALNGFVSPLLRTSYLFKTPESIFLFERDFAVTCKITRPAFLNNK